MKRVIIACAAAFGLMAGAASADTIKQGARTLQPQSGSYHRGYRGGPSFRLEFGGRQGLRFGGYRGGHDGRRGARYHNRRPPASN